MVKQTKKTNKGFKKTSGSMARGKMNTGRTRGMDSSSKDSRDGKDVMRNRTELKESGGQAKALDLAISQIDKCQDRSSKRF